MLVKRIQLGLIHAAVAMTLVPINSTLNRVMIKELALSATLVAALASLPYLFSPIQVAIGSFSDRHPLFGLAPHAVHPSGPAAVRGWASRLRRTRPSWMASDLPAGIAAGCAGLRRLGHGLQLCHCLLPVAGFRALRREGRVRAPWR